jgi:hypothetical protein
MTPKLGKVSMSRPSSCKVWGLLPRVSPNLRVIALTSVVWGCRSMGAGLPQLKAQKVFTFKWQKVSTRSRYDSSTNEGVLYVGRGNQITKWKTLKCFKHKRFLHSNGRRSARDLGRILQQMKESCMWVGAFKLQSEKLWSALSTKGFFTWMAEALLMTEGLLQWWKKKTLHTYLRKVSNKWLYPMAAYCWWFGTGASS